MVGRRESVRERVGREKIERDSETNRQTGKQASTQFLQADRERRRQRNLSDRFN